MQIKDSWSYKAKIQDIQLNRKNATGKWTLSGTLDWCDNNDLDKITKMISVSSSDKSPNLSKFLPSYIKALAIIAQRASNESTAEKEQTIKIAIYNGDISKDATSATVAMTPHKANEILQDIYTAAFGDESQLPYSKAVPASMLDASGIINIRTFKEKLLSESWKYFDKKTLFDPITDVGFDAINFTDQWKEATQKMRGLMQFTIDESESGKTAKKRKA